MKFVTQKAALCDALLSGRKLTIIDAFKEFGITNLPREIGRSIERAFGVVVAKVKISFINQYGEPGQCIRYRLLMNKYNELKMLDRKKQRQHIQGLQLMRKYVDEHSYPERIIWPTAIGHKESMPPKDDSHYVKTYPGFPVDEVVAHYAREAEKRVIPRCGKTTAEIVRDSIFTKEQIAEQKRKKK